MPKDTLPFRQVHLDFHTSECMPDVGSEFSEENFKKALIDGHISSITLFAKCHHGWMYYPSKVSYPHPTLKTNLLGRQLAVCKELGVRAQIYISAGFDEHRAVIMPHLMNINHGRENTVLGAHWHGLCLNNPELLNILKAETEEVMDTFKGLYDGLFYDIVEPSPCVCPVCVDSMLKLGMNPENRADVEAHRKIVYEKYAKFINNVVAAKDPDMPVFHNRNLPKNDRSVLYSNTKHIEIESLPTGGWGYDHFPLGAAYSRVLGREFLGMTGKFHKSWGEFGGYKHPNALKYETALSIANGAKCSVGDQLHPLGKFDNATYKLIGEAFADVEKKEKWCSDVCAVTDMAIFTTYDDINRGNGPDVGANRILLEGKYLYNIIDDLCDFSDYKLIVFPDTVKFDDALAAKVEAYLQNGGKILLSGQSGTKSGCENTFFKAFGISLNGENPLNDTFLVPTYDMKPLGIAPYLMYTRAYNIDADSDVKILANFEESYFNRAFHRFCSHKNTPNNPQALHPAAVISADGKIGYIAYNIFTDYGNNGALHAKQIVCDILDTLLGNDKTLTTSLPSNGVVTLMEQKEENRLVNHLLYCVTKKRGDTEVIEDAISIHDTSVSIKLSAKPRRVYLAPEEKDLVFTYENGILSYTVPEFTIHGMVVIEL